MRIPPKRDGEFLLLVIPSVRGPISCDGKARPAVGLGDLGILFEFPIGRRGAAKGAHVPEDESPLKAAIPDEVKFISVEIPFPAAKKFGEIEVHELVGAQVQNLRLADVGIAPVAARSTHEVRHMKSAFLPFEKQDHGAKGRSAEGFVVNKDNRRILGTMEHRYLAG